MKALICFLFIVTSVATVLADDDYGHEYAPIVEKQIEYRNWKYMDTRTGTEKSLRELSAGKKLVLVFYFAHWCHSSNFQAPITQKLYEKYRDEGLEVIGVSMYGTLEATQNKINWWKFSFPVVTESVSPRSRMTSQHFKYRTITGDKRKWATPWNIFLTPSEFNQLGDTLVEKAYVANGELREEEADKFIREKLGLPKKDRTD